MTIRKAYYLEEETIKLIKKQSKEIGINQSEFLNKLILGTNHVVLPEKKNHNLPFNHIELLKFIYGAHRVPISIYSLERLSRAPQALFSRRSVRNTIANLFEQGYIEREDRNMDNRVKHYKLTKKTDILMKKLNIVNGD